MADGFYINVVENVGVLALLAAGVALLRPYARSLPTRTLRDVAVGLLFAATATLVVLDPVRLPEGVTFDARGGSAILAGVFGAPLAVLVTAVAGVGGRLAIGGPVAVVGAVGFLLYGAAGLIAGWAFRRYGWRWSLLGYALVGLFGTYLYSPLADSQWTLALLRYGVFPAMALSGIAIWQQGRLARVFRVRQSAAQAPRPSRLR
jgi:hypothetical protein